MNDQAELLEFLRIMRKFCDFTEGVAATMTLPHMITRVDSIRTTINNYERLKLGSTERERRGRPLDRSEDGLTNVLDR